MRQEQQIKIILAVFAGLFLLVSFELAIQFQRGSGFRQKIGSGVLLFLIAANFIMIRHALKRDQRKLQ